MKLVTSPTRLTLENLGLDPGAGLGSSVSDDERRGSVLAWHLNHWALARSGGTGERSFLGDVSWFSGHPLCEFRHRLETMDRTLTGWDPDQRVLFGWEFLLTSNLWRSSRDVSAIYLVHAGFEEECRRLAEETGLPPSLAESLLRSWLPPFFRTTGTCDLFLLSVHHNEPNPESPTDLIGRTSGADELPESEMNAADPLPLGTWKLRKGEWEVAASEADHEVAGALKRLIRPPIDEDPYRALAHGRDRITRAVPVSPRTFRDARTIELRGIKRLEKERAKASADDARFSSRFGPRRRSFQIGRQFRSLLKRFFSGKRSS